jgi:copper chaperone NosL
MRVLALTVVVLLLLAAGYTFGIATPKDLAQYPQCLHCGMDRTQCKHTRVSIEFADGTKAAECSLQCLVATLKEQPWRRTKTISAADYNDKKLVPAESCSWVRYDNAVSCQGSRVMLAFRSESAADRFVHSFGGRKMTFNDALLAAAEKP